MRQFLSGSVIGGCLCSATTAGLILGKNVEVATIWIVFILTIIVVLTAVRNK